MLLYSSLKTLERDRQWKIAEVSAPLNTNTYRIRNLNGTTLHMKSGGDVAAEKNIYKGAHEKVFYRTICFHKVDEYGLVDGSVLWEWEIHDQEY